MKAIFELRVLATIALISLATVQSLAFEIHAHRGGPAKDLEDSSIETIQRSIQQGADVIEFDVQMATDGKYVISHDPVFTEKSCACSSSSVVKQKSYVIYQMMTDELSTFLKNDSQEKAFPVLEDYVKQIDQIDPRKSLSIELKYDSSSISLPPRKLMVDNFLLFLYRNNFFERVIIQSFDKEIFEEIRRSESAYGQAHARLSFLYRGEPRLNIDAISMWPWNRYPDWNKALEFSKKIDAEYISPRFSLIESNQKEYKNFLKRRNKETPQLKILPWTMNNLESMKKSKILGVDGILTDEVALGVKFK